MKGKQLAFVFLLLIFIVSSAGAAYFYTKYHRVALGGAKESADEVARVVDEIGKHMVLPTGEEPTMATVIDKAALDDQPFFERAKEGDQVIIYANARKAILYRPVSKKIIEVAPIYFADPEDTNGLEEVPDVVEQPETEPLRIAYYRHLDQLAQASQAQVRVADAFSNVSLVGSYDLTAPAAGTLVVDLTGTFSTEATTIAGIIGGSVGSLPDGMTPINADIVVIVGE